MKQQQRERHSKRITALKLREHEMKSEAHDAQLKSSPTEDSEDDSEARSAAGVAAK